MEAADGAVVSSPAARKREYENGKLGTAGTGWNPTSRVFRNWALHEL